jgi:hypothetical protein
LPTHIDLAGEPSGGGHLIVVVIDEIVDGPDDLRVGWRLEFSTNVVVEIATPLAALVGGAAEPRSGGAIVAQCLVECSE